MNKANIINLRTVEDIDKWLEEEDNIYIGRSTEEIPSGSDWGNPYTLGTFKSRRKVVQLYEEHVKSTKDLLNTVSGLKGKVLGCWCAPDQCHGEVLHKLAGNHPVYQFKEPEGGRENKMDCSFSKPEDQEALTQQSWL